MHQPPRRLAVIIATVGRAPLLSRTVAHLARQHRKPDEVIIVSVSDEDVAGLPEIGDFPVRVLFSAKGLPIQRNAGLRAAIAAGADFATFFDDDFVPADDYLAELERIFVTCPCVVGATGRLIADGIKGAGVEFDEALALIASSSPPQEITERKMPALYGCNLSIRVASAQGIWFDERLPLYGWQEDVDFSYRLGQRGVLLLTSAIAGVHMGAKTGRQSGRRLGYSQIANPVYLLRKKSIPVHLARRLMWRNVAANVIRAIKPEPHVDRIGRLMGNCIAIGHLLSGRLHPERVMSL